MADYVYSNGQDSLRLRRPSSRGSNRNYPHFNWDPAASEGERDEEVDDEDVDGGGESGQELRELRTIPLPMVLKRAVRSEFFCKKFLKIILVN